MPVIPVLSRRSQEEWSHWPWPAAWKDPAHWERGTSHQILFMYPVTHTCKLEKRAIKLLATTPSPKLLAREHPSRSHKPWLSRKYARRQICGHLHGAGAHTYVNRLRHTWAVCTGGQSIHGLCVCISSVQVCCERCCYNPQLLVHPLLPSLTSAPHLPHMEALLPI